MVNALVSRVCQCLSSLGNSGIDPAVFKDHFIVSFSLHKPFERKNLSRVRIHHNLILHRMPFLLSGIEELLALSILWSLHESLGTVHDELPKLGTHLNPVMEVPDLSDRQTKLITDGFKQDLFQSPDPELDIPLVESPEELSESKRRICFVIKQYEEQLLPVRSEMGLSTTARRSQPWLFQPQQFLFS